MRRLLLLSCLALLLPAGLPPAALAQQTTGPTVTTRAASPVGMDTATVRGSVNPNGVPTTYRFEYGTTTAYGLQTADASAGSGALPVDVQAQLAGLSPDTTYHYRLIAFPTNDPSAVVPGSDRTFHTIDLPRVSTGSPSDVRPDGVTLVGKVDPNRSPTTWYFEWGATQSYGNQTPVQDAGRGSGLQTVSAVLNGLTPNATYHVRIVATNAAGIKRGRDRGFKTSRQPTGIVVSGPTVQVGFGGTATITGQVQGAGVARIRVGLEDQPFPFSSPFAPAGDVVTTSATGTFRLLTPPLWRTSRLHVVTRTTPPVVSPVVTAGVRLLVRAAAHRVDRRRYRVEGTVTPDVTRAKVSLQRRAGRRWVLVHRTSTSRSHGRVRYGVIVRRASRARTYRVLVTPRNGAYVRTASNKVRVPRLGR